MPELTPSQLSPQTTAEYENILTPIFVEINLLNQQMQVVGYNSNMNYTMRNFVCKPPITNSDIIEEIQVMLKQRNQ